MDDLNQISLNYTLTIDDDPLVRKIVEVATGIRSLSFASVQSLRSRGQRYRPRGLFLDVNLGGGETGLDLIPTLRSWWPYCPIIMITATENESVIGQALAAGVNDYIKKPINALELNARFRARSIEMQERTSREILQIGDIRFDTVRRYLEKESRVRHLTEIDARLLAYLARSMQTLVDKKDLKSAIWGNMKISDNALDKRISEVRRALSDVSKSVRLASYYGRGVQLVIGE